MDNSLRFIRIHQKYAQIFRKTSLKPKNRNPSLFPHTKFREHGGRQTNNLILVVTLLIITKSKPSAARSIPLENSAQTPDKRIKKGKKKRTRQKSINYYT